MLSIYKEVILLLVAAMIMCLSVPPTTGIITDQGLLFLCIESMLPSGWVQLRYWGRPIPGRHGIPMPAAFGPWTSPEYFWTLLWQHGHPGHFHLDFLPILLLWDQLLDGFPSLLQLVPYFLSQAFFSIKNLRTFNLILISYSWRTQPNTLVIKSNTQGKWKGTLSGSTK